MFTLVWFPLLTRLCALSQVVKLFAWLLPSDHTTEQAKWLLCTQLHPETGYIKDPVVNLVASLLHPYQIANVEWAITENVHYMLRDQWYKDYVKSAFLAQLEEFEEKQSGKKKS